jgi:hypothetical protein
MRIKNTQIEAHTVDRVKFPIIFSVVLLDDIIQLSIYPFGAVDSYENRRTDHLLWNAWPSFM